MTVLFVVPSDGFLPSGTVRVRQFLPWLERDGVRYHIVSYYSPACDRLAARARTGVGLRRRVMLAVAAAGQVASRWIARVKMLWFARRSDVVFLQGVLPPVWHIEAMRRLSPRIVLDLDDAIFLGNPSRGAAVVSRMWHIVAGSHFIYDYARALTPNVTLVPSAVSVERYTPAASATSEPDTVHIGWLGSRSTVRYLSHLVGPLRQLAAEGHRLTMHIDGADGNKSAISAIHGVSVASTMHYGDADIPGLVARYDIGVMPLDDGPWERAKCAMKALIYMAAGKPVLLSRVGENSFVVEDGVNGYLAGSEAEWTEKLRRLVTDPALRAEIGQRGRETVEARYDARVCYDALKRQVFGRASGPLAEVVN